jgi:hypothetical protein
MSPQNRILTEISAPARFAVIDAGTRRNLHIRELKGMPSLLVPHPWHLALFDLFPIWGTVKSPIPVTSKRYFARPPARNSN